MSVHGSGSAQFCCFVFAILGVLAGCSAQNQASEPAKQSATTPEPTQASAEFRVGTSTTHAGRPVLIASSVDWGGARSEKSTEITLPRGEIDVKVFEHPRSVAVAPKTSTDDKSRVYVVFGGSDVTAGAPLVAEYSVTLWPKPKAESARIFALPERRALQGVSARVDERGARLYINIPKAGDARSGPIVYIYAIEPAATNKNPIDIRVPPRR